MLLLNSLLTENHLEIEVEEKAPILKTKQKPHPSSDESVLKQAELKYLTLSRFVSRVQLKHLLKIIFGFVKLLHAKQGFSSSEQSLFIGRIQLQSLKRTRPNKTFSPLVYGRRNSLFLTITNVHNVRRTKLSRCFGPHTLPCHSFLRPGSAPAPSESTWPG